MSLFKTYMEAAQKDHLGLSSAEKKLSKQHLDKQYKPGDNFNFKRPNGKTGRMMIEKMTDKDVFYRWVDEKNNITNGKVSRRMFDRDIERGEAKKVELK